MNIHQLQSKRTTTALRCLYLCMYVVGVAPGISKVLTACIGYTHAQSNQSMGGLALGWAGPTLFGRGCMTYDYIGADR